MVVVAAGRDEHGLIPVTRLLLEAENADVEVERPLNVCDLEVDVADVDAWIDCHPETVQLHAPRRGRAADPRSRPSLPISQVSGLRGGRLGERRGAL